MSFFFCFSFLLFDSVSSHFDLLLLLYPPDPSPSICSKQTAAPELPVWSIFKLKCSEVIKSPLDIYTCQSVRIHHNFKKQKRKQTYSLITKPFSAVWLESFSLWTLLKTTFIYVCIIYFFFILIFSQFFVHILYFHISFVLEWWLFQFHCPCGSWQ